MTEEEFIQLCRDVMDYKIKKQKLSLINKKGTRNQKFLRGSGEAIF